MLAYCACPYPTVRPRAAYWSLLQVTCSFSTNGSRSSEAHLYTHAMIFGSPPPLQHNAAPCRHSLATSSKLMIQNIALIFYKTPWGVLETHILYSLENPHNSSETYWKNCGYCLILHTGVGSRMGRGVQRIHAPIDTPTFLAPRFTIDRL